jgi:pimeloyl-ACP methyl ester carboxylesterase
MRLPYWLVEAHRKLDAPVVAPTMTLDRMTQDGIELTEYLCKHLGKRKVILVAHSFGTILGLRMIREKPDLFFAYVGTGQVADETQNYAMAYEALLKGSGANMCEGAQQGQWRSKDYAASTAFQIAGTVWFLIRRLPRANCPLRIRWSSSIPAMVVAAQSKFLKPSIGPVRDLIPR